jgi:hypothetical protein
MISLKEFAEQLRFVILDSLFNDSGGIGHLCKRDMEIIPAGHCYILRPKFSEATVFEITVRKTNGGID